MLAQLEFEPLTTERFTAFLGMLSKECYIVGSFARGDIDHGHISDIDLRPIGRDDDGQDRRFSRVKEIFAEFGVTWDSCFCGCISTPRDTEHMPRPIEVCTFFDRIAPANRRIIVEGIEFRT